MLKDEIKKIIPHREPMLLIDEVILDKNGQACGKYKVRGDEWFLQGHYPDNPIVPGVIQCEILAQTCCLLFKDNIKGKTPLFAGMEKVKFKGIVRAGDILETVCNIKQVRDPFYFASGKGYIKGKLCVSGSFSFALMKGE